MQFSVDVQQCEHRMTEWRGKPSHPVLGASRVPRYLQLADIFRQRIARGVWATGAMLPSIELLMQEFSVARVTVRQAIRLLSDEGLVSPQRGKGTVVNEVTSPQRLLRVDTTLAGLVAMYRCDKPVLTNLEESNASFGRQTVCQNCSRRGSESCPADLTGII